jgi:hypothetical protein
MAVPANHCFAIGVVVQLGLFDWNVPPMLVETMPAFGADGIDWD